MTRRTRADILWVILATILIEGVTCLFRFGIGMQSTRDTRAIGRFTFGLRVHHGYVGLAFVVASLLMADNRARTVLLLVGAALALSDLIHHFLVLWPVTGSPHFDLFYAAGR